MATPSPGISKQMPKDALVIASILKEFGITHYEPRVINQLLEFTYGYVTSVLEDAKVYSNHAKKKIIDLDDVRLAVQMQQDKCFTTPQSRDVLLELARVKNNNPLPLVKPHCGIRLPPDRYCLNNSNYRLKSNKKASYGVQPTSFMKLGGKGPQLQLLGHSRPPSSLSMPRTPNPIIPKGPISVKYPYGDGLFHTHELIEAIQPHDLPESLKRKRESDEFAASALQLFKKLPDN